MKRVVVRGATASHNGILSSKGISLEEKDENGMYGSTLHTTKLL